MSEFQLIGTHLGVPVYYQEMAESKAAAIQIVIFAGCADDQSTKVFGGAHYAEHWPGRGTRSYPNGAKDTKGPIVECGGRSNAGTTRTRTRFHAVVPARKFELAIDITASHLTEPLLEDKGFDSEKKVILQELAQSLSTPQRWGWYYLQQYVTPGHPIALPILGTEDSLKNMTADELRSAYGQMYCRSRMVVVAAGPQPSGAFLETIQPHIEAMPDHGLSERRRADTYGRQDSFTTEYQEVDFPFKKSVVNQLWLVNATSPRESLVWDIVTDMFGAGGMSSPLLLNLREQKGLVYSAGFTKKSERDFVLLNLNADAKQGTLKKVIEGCWEVHADPKTMSTDRFETVKEMSRGAIEMRKIYPEDECTIAVNEITRWGHTITMDEHLKMIDEITFEEVREAFSALARENSKTVIFKGND